MRKVGTITVEETDLTSGLQKTQIVGATGNVAVVSPANTSRTATDKVILVQTIGPDGSVNSGSSAVDDAAFDDAADKGTIIMGVTGAANISTSGHQGAVGMTLKRELMVMTNAHSYLQSTHSSPTDGAVTYLGVNSLTCTGFPFTVDSSVCAIRSIGVTNAANVMTQWENGVNCSIYSSANVIYILNTAGVSFTAFLATDLSYKVAIAYQQKAYDQGTDVLKVMEQSPDRVSFVLDSLVDTTNVAAATGYYPSTTGMSMDGFKNLSLTGKIIEGDAVLDSIELEVTNDEDSATAD